MSDEVTKSLEEELDEIDYAGEIYEDELDDNSDQTTDDNSDDTDDQSTDNESATTRTEEGSDGKEKDSKEEGVGEETSEETDTSGKTESEETEEGEAESEASEDLDGQQRINSLMAEIDRLSGLLVTQIPAVKLDSPEHKPKLDTETIKLPEVEDFIGDLDMDDVASDPKIMNKLLNKVLQKGIETGKNLSKDQITAVDSSVSQTVATQVDSAIALKGMIDEFYGANPELSNVKQVVQACASQIVQESPDKTFKDVLNMAAAAARKTLGISKSKSKTKIAKVEDAAFVEQKGGQRRKARKTSKLQQELDEL